MTGKTRRILNYCEKFYSYHSGQSTLPPFLAELLNAPPKAGEGVHHWLFSAARQLHAHLPAVEIIGLLENRVQGCGRHVNRKEITDAVQNALPCAWQPRGSTAPVPSVPTWPAVNREQREAVVRDLGGLADLWELSNPRFDDGHRTAKQLSTGFSPAILCSVAANPIRNSTPNHAKIGGEKCRNWP